MRFKISAVTDIGLTKDVNQDSYSVRIYSTAQGSMAFSVLCDGMGGLADGEVASSTLVKAFCRWAEERLPILSKNDISEVEIHDDWTDIIVKYNEKMKVYGLERGILLGTTVAVILVTKNWVYMIHVGDTRIYELEESIKLLTKDHTLVEREVAFGNITSKEAKIDARRHILLQCVGASEEITPVFSVQKTKEHAMYLLCSDGFRHEITQEEIFRNLRFAGNSKRMKKQMEMLVRLNKERQERDNITVVGIRTV